MWALQFYVKADQLTYNEHSICIDEVVNPLLSARHAVLAGDGIADVAVQCVRGDSAYAVARSDGSLGTNTIAHYWKGTRRFRLRDAASIEDITRGPEPEVGDMSSAWETESFMRWAREGASAATQRAMVLWGHTSAFGSVLLSRELNLPFGPGIDWRPLFAELGKCPLCDRIDEGEIKRRYPTLMSSGGHNGHAGDRLKFRGLPELGRGIRAGIGGTARLDVLIFNSCYMACIEVAYEVRGCAQILVASEDYTPFRQWNHADWPRWLADRPDADAEALAQYMVRSYRPGPNNTVSAFRLGVAIEDIRDAIDRFVEAASTFGDEDWRRIASARDATRQYGDEMYDEAADVLMVDIIQVFGEIAARTPAARAAAVRVVAACEAARVGYDRGSDRGGAYGSFGLSIFFPNSQAEFDRLMLRGRYDPDNPDAPAFVSESRWREFLDEYWRKRGQLVRPAPQRAPEPEDAGSR